MSSFLFSIDNVIDNKYKVKFSIRVTEKYQSYRVYSQKNKEKALLLKIITDSSIVDDVILSFRHPNFIGVIESGTLIVGNKNYPYIVSDFYGYENLEEYMDREMGLSLNDSKNVILGVLNFVKYIYSKGYYISLLKPTEIILIPIGKSYTIKINDAIYLSKLTNENDLQKTFKIIGETYFYLVTGDFFDDASDFDKYDLFSKKVENIILRAMSIQSFRPFSDVDEFIQEMYYEKEYYSTHKQIKFHSSNKKINDNRKAIGFSAIAGMEGLKALIQVDIIDALNQKEKYQKYGITIPNGMLLYGPPGCGKTFFAERMAEEVGAKFYQLKPSDIQSKWVNASQENVKDLFDDASQNSPSIIFIDELDAIVPSRDTDNICHMNTSVVNEFLAQMNNCSEKGIFIIGATNRPDAIDSAILRSGRLDKHIYLPVPDLEARRKMFELYLSKRPIEKDLDYTLLADKTENFVSSDIKFLCDEASRFALKMDSNISLKMILDVISKSKPSISVEELDKYKEIERKFSGKAPKSRIGF